MHPGTYDLIASSYSLFMQVHAKRGSSLPWLVVKQSQSRLECDSVEIYDSRLPLHLVRRSRAEYGGIRANLSHDSGIGHRESPFNRQQLLAMRGLCLPLAVAGTVQTGVLRGGVYVPHAFPVP